MKKKTINDFIREAKAVHGDKYLYTESSYVSNSVKLKIICKEHGEFFKTPIHHVNRKQGCPKCASISKIKLQRKSLDKFMSEANLVHGGRYDYSDVNYITSKKHVLINCPVHGAFNQTPDNHLSGRGCKYCGGTTKLNNKSFIRKLYNLYGDDFIYDKIDYINMSTLVTVTCKTHGDFKQTPNNLLSKRRGCPYCDNKRIFDTKSFVNKANMIHGNKFNYDKTKFIDLHTELTMECPEHGLISVTPHYHLNYFGCKKCGNSTSKLEDEINDFILELGINVINNTRTIIPPLELDLYLPDYKLAIEVNGLYWHSELYKDKDYHLNKSIKCEEHNIRLIHIFEDEWVNNKDIVKSRLRNLLGLTPTRIYARKCEVREVPTRIKTDFLNTNHIQGSVGSKVNLGLYYNDELVALMTFGKRPVFNDYEYELIRFCNKVGVSVVGGAGRLLKSFIRLYSPKEVISYADRRWSTGNLYNKLGFEFISNTDPSWFIVNNGVREHRVKYQKHKLIEQGFDENKTAHQICLDNNLYRIYDCGTKKYGLIINY